MGADRRTRRRRLMWVMVPLAVAALLSGCAAAPRAVLQVPGTYVANLWEPTIDGPYGNAAATVVMCLDTESAVLLETGEGSEGAVGSIRLTWAGVVHESSAFREATTLTTPVLQPGCGLLTFGVDCCHVDHYLAIRATKV